MLWSYRTLERTQIFLIFDKVSVMLLEVVITVRSKCMIGLMSKHMGYPGNDFCIFLDKQEEYILYECQDLREHHSCNFSASKCTFVQAEI